MKATILFLMMLLLVAAAGFVFLFQSSLRLRDEARAIATDNETLRAEVAAAELTLSGEVATREAVAAALATVEQDNLLLDGQLVDSQQTLDELTARHEELGQEVTALQEELAQVQGEASSRPPVARIVTPDDGAALPLDQPVEVVVVAADSVGLSSLTLEVDGRPYDSQTLSGETLFARTLNWPAPAEAGEHTFTISATNRNGIGSEPQTITIQIEDIEAANAAIRAEVEANVEELRGLSLLSPIAPVVLSRDQLRDRLAAESAAETTPEEARADVLELAAFDFIAPDYDLYTALLQVQSESVLGFYDPETAQFVVVNDAALLDAPAQWTHAHEYVHALQDQHHNLDALTDDALDSEARAAVRALAEGEAELVQFLYLAEGNYFSDAEIEAIIADAMENSGGDLAADFPPILIAGLTFPYAYGSPFVDALYDAGGFAAIDEAWADPPRSTEQIMHPDRYLAGDAPRLVALAPLTPTLGAAWQPISEDILGEFYLREYLDQQLATSAAERAAAGWGGDRYAVYWNEGTGDLVMALRLVWDADEDAAEFAASYAEYAAGRLGVEAQAQPNGSDCWPGEYVLCFLQVGGDSFVVRAPDVATATAIFTAIR